MASRSNRSGGTALPKRRLILLLVLIAALLATLAVGSRGGKSRWAPEFALDLQGGTQIILTPVTTDGSDISRSDVNQAIQIIRQRVDASGVAEAEINSQGGRNIVVGLPGNPSKETRDLVKTSAVLRMRPVLQVSGFNTPLTPSIVSQIEAARAKASQSQSSGAASPSPSPSASSPSAKAPATYSPQELKAQAAKYADADGDGKISDTPKASGNASKNGTPANASDPGWITEKTNYDAYMLDCSKKESASVGRATDPKKALVACDPTTKAKYILGPAEIEGTQLTQASSGINQRGQYAVSIRFNSSGTKTFDAVTQRLVRLQSPRNQFAIVLDGNVISAASPSSRISNGSAEITGGGINAKTSKTLANQLSFGSLPLQFKVQSEEQISATLGSESLRAGLMAGVIGVVLLALYLLWTYQGLGVVAIGSVALATGLSYLIVSLLSWTIGYRLSMAGVVGFIISIGITADSFIVFFERIRDEIREGRSLRSAVWHGWHRAKRTIYVADGCNLLCAVVLYFLAVGSVRGFAFTLGLTTILDLVVVIMFTYPVMALLVRRKFFGEGHRFSGMSAEMLGHEPRYRGRGRRLADSRPSRASRASDAPSGGDGADGGGDPQSSGLSLAERKALARKMARNGDARHADGVSSASREEEL